jgi:hypothetical protein
MNCPYVKNTTALILAALYLPLVILGNGQLTICVAENGRMQIEYGAGSCDVAPVHTDSSSIASTCGDCIDTMLQAGETLRVNNNSGATQIQTVAICRIVDQKTMPAQTYVEPDSSAPDLVGSGILII